MTTRIYSSVTTSISELKKNPSKMTKHDVVCVLNRCEPAFYCVDPVRMAQLMEAEEKLIEITSSQKSTSKFYFSYTVDNCLVSSAIFTGYPTAKQLSDVTGVNVSQQICDLLKNHGVSYGFSGIYKLEEIKQ